MAPKNKCKIRKRSPLMNKGAWTAEEDKLLADYIQEHGTLKWKTVALKAGLKRCGKSCRLRWLNYLRPNIKRGNISDEEEDLILRLHKLLGNRWSLIAGRLPGRTDNEIKNYWNSHLSKKIDEERRTVELQAPPPITQRAVMEESREETVMEESREETVKITEDCREETVQIEDTEISFDVDDLFDFSAEGTYGLDWVNEFLVLDELDSGYYLT